MQLSANLCGCPLPDHNGNRRLAVFQFEIGVPGTVRSTVVADFACQPDRREAVLKQFLDDARKLRNSQHRQATRITWQVGNQSMAQCKKLNRSDDKNSAKLRSIGKWVS